MTIMSDHSWLQDTIDEGDFEYRLLESIQDGVYAMDIEGRLTYVNESVVRRTGLSREFLLGKKFDILVSDTYKEIVQRNFKDRIQGKVIPPCEISHTVPSGKILWVEISTIALLHDEHVIGVVAITHDITERKRIENELRESEQRFRSLFENHDAIMLLFDPVSGEIVDVNQAAVHFYGHNRTKMCQMNIREINHLSPDEITEEEALRKKEKRGYFIFPHILANGEIRIVEVHSTPVDIQGRTLFFSIVHDITERTKAKEALKHYRDHLEELVKKRTSTLEIKNSQLMSEISQRKAAEAEREKLIFELQGALARIKALSGLLPICSACKKIRDDRGYWEQIEIYIAEHSEADFSHSICPECSARMYPEL